MAAILPQFDDQTLRAFLDALHECVAVVDAQSRVVFANRSWLQAFRVREDDALGKLPGEAMHCLHSEDHGCGGSTWCPCGLSDGIQDALAGSRPSSVEPFSVPIRVGETVEVRNYDVHILPLREGDGGPEQVAVLMKDMTHLMQRIDELRLHQTMLERRALQCETLAENLLQDVRLPLQRILELLKHPDDAALPSAMATLALSVENVSILGQMDPEGLPMAKELLDPDAFAAETVGALAPVIPEKGVSLEYVPPDGVLPPVSVDRRLLRLILENLIRNALTQGVEGSRVRLSAEVELGKTVLLRIAYHAKPLPPELLENVFDPFFHLERPEGQGRRNRGLAFCRLAARAQGGDLRAENTPTGVCMVLSLPARRRTTSATDQE